MADIFISRGARGARLVRVVGYLKDPGFVVCVRGIYNIRCARRESTLNMKDGGLLAELRARAPREQNERAAGCQAGAGGAVSK
jgi:hypothetical protein